MASLNKVMLIGNLGRDIELRYTPSGQARAEFSMATSRNFKRNDEWVEETDWHNIVMWGERAERAAEQLRKGKQVYVEGRLSTRSWDDEKTGDKKYRTEVIADRVFALGRKEEGETPSFVPPAEGFGSTEPVPSPTTGTQKGINDFDDLPF